jgi:hypothetical protein
MLLCVRITQNNGRCMKRKAQAPSEWDMDRNCLRCWCVGELGVGGVVCLVLLFFPLNISLVSSYFIRSRMENPPITKTSIIINAAFYLIVFFFRVLRIPKLMTSRGALRRRACWLLPTTRSLSLLMAAVLFLLCPLETKRIIDLLCLLLVCWVREFVRPFVLLVLAWTKQL